MRKGEWRTDTLSPRVKVTHYVQRRSIREDPFHKRQVKRYGRVPTRIYNAQHELDEKGFYTRLQVQAGLGWVLVVEPSDTGGAFISYSHPRGQQEVREIADKHHLRSGFDFFSIGHEKAYLEMPSEEYARQRGWD